MKIWRVEWGDKIYFIFLGGLFESLKMAWELYLIGEKTLEFKCKLIISWWRNLRRQGRFGMSTPGTGKWKTILHPPKPSLKKSYFNKFSMSPQISKFIIPKLSSPKQNVKSTSEKGNQSLSMTSNSNSMSKVPLSLSRLEPKWRWLRGQLQNQRNIERWP